MALSLKPTVALEPHHPMTLPCRQETSCPWSPGSPLPGLCSPAHHSSPARHSSPLRVTTVVHASLHLELKIFVLWQFFSHNFSIIWLVMQMFTLADLHNLDCTWIFLIYICWECPSQVVHMHSSNLEVSYQDSMPATCPSPEWPEGRLIITAVNSC